MSYRDDEVRRGHAGYPERLAGVRDAPDRLWSRGPWPEAGLIVAIVGARAASCGGGLRARELARELSGAGALVISGGAVGIDSAAHRGALEAGGPTAAVLACGLDVAYPAHNRPLFGDICAGGGALITPYAPGQPPRRHHFVRRNRVMAGLADAVVLVDCRLGSGALHTAAAAQEYGRVLGAVPGSPGCEALIAQGAAVVESAADVRSAIAGAPRRPVADLPEPGTAAARVLTALGGGEPAGEDAIARATGLGARQVTRALAGLELEGLAVLLPGRAYVRSTIAQELLAS